MTLRALLGASALVASVSFLHAGAANAGFDRHRDHDHIRKGLHALAHDVRSVVLCPLEWFRHRHERAAYTPAPKKVHYAKKVAAKKAAMPLK